MEFSKALEVTKTTIPGLLLLSLPVHGDNRGWFKENWQREKMTALGLPDFGPVQNNISFNAKHGTTRGIHAEPWDKYVSVATGRIFGAWVDLREGDSFGTVFTTEIDPSQAIFVPRGVGNAFQTLEDDTAYSYLVNDHWNADNKDYAFLNLADETIGIDWPFPLDEAELSDKDKNHPRLADVTPIAPRKILITGANGQLGEALKVIFPAAEFVTRTEFDIADQKIWQSRNWRQYSTIINAAAYTNVDGAETKDGRKSAWSANAVAVSLMAKTAAEYSLTLIHISSDYVFDGSNTFHSEEESFSPLGVYGQTKAAGDIAAATAPRHYIIRTSWVIGSGNNFVATMHQLAENGINPSVVNDQIGRPTFTSDIANAINHLLSASAPFGTYNVSCGGEPVSWHDLAQRVFTLTGNDPGRISGISTAKYFKDKPTSAPRPLQSTLDLAKIEATGFKPRGWEPALEEYIRNI